MKTTIYIVIFIIAFCYLSKINISFNPFSIKFNTLELGIGWLLLMTGFALVSYNTKKEAIIEERSENIKEFYSEGLRDGHKFAIDQVNEKINEAIEKFRKENPNNEIKSLEITTELTTNK